MAQPMHRLTSALLLGAGVLVTTWVSAPAAPTAPPPRASAEEVAHVEALAPLAADVNQEVARLRAQLAVVPQMPEPARDPFSFGGRRPAPRAVVAEPAPAAPVASSEVESALVWPTLAAVMAEESGQTAVMAWGDAVEFLKAGDTFKDFTVVSVSAGAVELRHEPTRSSKTLTLR